MPILALPLNPVLSRPLMRTHLKRSAVATIAGFLVSLAAFVVDPNPHGGLGLLALAVLWLGSLISLAIIVLVGLAAFTQGDRERGWWYLTGVPIGILLGSGVGSFVWSLILSGR